MTDRLPGLHLQRRAGRRKSNPASPTSPTFRSRFGKSFDSSLSAFSPSEATTSNTFDDSPAIDLEVPSPTFDLSTISTTTPSESHAPRWTSQASRASDDFGKTRPKFWGDTTRPSTSSAVGAVSYSSQGRPMYSPEPPSSRGSPSAGSQRTSADAQRRPLSRENHEEAAAQRAAAFWAQYDQRMAEDKVNSKKSIFNVFNPMTLLNRRRSSQNTNKLDDVSLSATNLHVPAIPDNIETSIRGSIVHDFSVPRARRVNFEASPRPLPTPSPSYPRRPSEMSSPPMDASVATPSSLHSPMFKEHFQEEERPVQPANTAYLHAQNLQVPSSGSLPTFAKKLPLVLPGEELINSPAGLPTTTSLKESDTQQVPPEPDLPPPPPPPAKTPSPVLDFATVTALPKHMTSTSSRFSFLGQQGSIAQEKFLEEKHKEHALKNPAPVRLSVASVDDIDDYDGYDDLDDEDGFDNEDIMIKNIDLPSSQLPRLNSMDEDDEDISEGVYHYDDEDDEFGTGDIEIKNVDVPTSLNKLEENRDNGVDKLNFSADNTHFASSQNGIGETPLLKLHQQSLQGFHFTPQSLSFSPTTTQHTSQSTPRDVEGFVIGMAHSKERATYDEHPRIRDSMDQSPENMFYEGLGISTTHPEVSSFTQPPLQPQPFDDSDLYFDDGEFDDHVIEPGSHFDEEALDDASQIKDIPAENARKYEEALQRNSAGETPQIFGQQQHQSLPSEKDTTSQLGNIGLSDQPAVLTEDNLAAYHDALVTAANKAAADGKFNRIVSFSQLSDDETDSPFHNSIPGISSRGSRYSNNIIGSGFSDEDGYGFDDDMDDDAMIAAANAEALENDDDGIYGQEFGFYARAHSKESADFVNGGFFASRGSNGLKRSHSGKNNFQEPSLTPITERSEWSMKMERNSPIVDDDMSLSALLKLRERAFGGSSTSINSLRERHYSHSSPLAHTAGFGAASGEGMARKMSSPTPNRSAMSIAESEDEDEEAARLTLTQNTPHKRSAVPIRDSSHSSQEQGRSAAMSRKSNHSRNSSGAESVSYAQDEDGRWVLERRRTGDDGEVELIDREYLAGVRI